MSALSANSRLVAVGVSLVLSACAAGTKFVRPPPDAVQLGKTTYSQLVERFGKPNNEQRVRRNDRLLRVITYVYSSAEEPAKVPGTRGGRHMEFLLSDDIVIGEGFVSSFASDSTDFDERKVKDIVKGKTRCEEVVAMFGPPSVSIIYPLTEKQGETAIGYTFGYAKGPLLQFKTFEKTLMVLCDPSGAVTRVSYSEEEDR